MSHRHPSIRRSWLYPLSIATLLVIVAASLSYLPTASYTSPQGENADFPAKSVQDTPTETQGDKVTSPKPTAILVINPDQPAMPVISLDKAQTVQTEPLRFSFPTPGPAPVSALRPALYPVPWALTPYDHFYFSRPIAADEINWPLADYRYGGVFFEDVIHTGVDIPAPMDTPVLSAGPGKVTWAGYGLYYGYYDTSDPYGMAVLVRHDFGFQGEKLYTVYAHLDRVDVAKGQYVETGEQLGLSGQTGKVTGPHLHFEVRLGKDGIFTTRNPELWLVPPQGWGVLAGRIMNNRGVVLESHLVTVRSLVNGQIWRANSYGRGPVVSDPYYRENLVVSDLPAGRYEIEINFWGKDLTQDIEIRPGLVSYFTLRGLNGYSLDSPLAPGEDFSPIP
jgi:murein DD-endopeptidase MepM/ murein hydrolase activator NlpD